MAKIFLRGAVAQKCNSADNQGMSERAEQIKLADNIRRRPAAVPQASIARAVRVAQSAGPEWRVAIDGNVIHIFQGPAPIAIPESEFARGLGIVP